MINTCSAFFRGILATAVSVFVVNTQYFQAVRFCCGIFVTVATLICVADTHERPHAESLYQPQMGIDKKRIGVESLSRAQ